MTAGAPWSVKGIDPKAREVAKDLARRSGMTLGEWLNQVILQDDGPEEVTSESYFADRGGRSYLETPRSEPAPPSRIEAPKHPGDEIGRMAAALDRLTARIEASEVRTSQAITGVEQSVREAVSRIEAAERDHVAVAARFEGAVDETNAQHAKLAERLRQMEQEAAGPRSAEALKSLEGALGKVANHLYEGETRNREMVGAMATRVAKLESREPVDPAAVVETVIAQLGERLSDAESRTTEALQALRQSFATLDGRLGTVEGGASPAMDRRLEDLAANLTNRLEAARGEMAEKLRTTVDGRFDRMERTLGELAQQVRTTEQQSAQAIEKMGREVLSIADDLNRRVQVSETRSAEAIDKVGGEVARIAQSMEARFTRSDSVHAQALERLGGEIARITERLAERIGAAERRSAQAIDDVGEQVARVTERLNLRAERTSEDLVERIRQSEERTAKLLEEAREKIDRRLADVQARAVPAAPAIEAATPAAAAPASAFLDDPFAGLPPEPEPAEPPAAVAPVQTEAAAAFPADEFPAAAPAPPPFAAEDYEAAETFAAPKIVAETRDEPATGWFRTFKAPGFEPSPVDRTEDEPASLAEDAETPAAASAADEDLFAPAAAADAPAGFDPATGFDAPADFEAQDEFVSTASEAAEDQHAPVAEAAAAASDEDDGFAAPPAAGEEDAFAAQAADAYDPFGPPASAEDDTGADELQAEAAEAPVEDAEPARPLTTREIVEQARAAARSSTSGADGRNKKIRITPKADKSGKPGAAPLFSSFGLGRSKRRAGSTLQTFLMVSGGAAFLGLAAGGIALMESQPSGETPKRVADAIAAANPGEVAGQEADTTPYPRAAVALAPQALGETTTPSAIPPDGAAGQDLAAIYAEAVRALDAGEAGGLDTLRKAANLGHAPAQFYLGKLYESGESGVKKDPVEARRWTERAAQGGDRRAMHNLALYYFHGDGGAKNSTTAAQWFRRAADLGLVDSQYNLGRLYEEGLGVSQNAAEAYKWYLVAARSGDGESRISASRVRAQLSPEAKSVAERAAAGFRAASAAPPTASAGADGGSVLTAQRALSRLGYYQGPSDGSASPALRLAVAAYQRDQGMAATGALDATTVSRLAVFTR